MASRSSQLFAAALQRIPGSVNSPVRAFRRLGREPGHVDALLVQAGSGALTHGRPDNAGVPAEFAALTISIPFNDIEAVRAAFRENPKTIAAIILEPIPANAGLYFPRENFLQALRDECDRRGALQIFDEVMTGFRVARGGVQA